MVNILAYDSVFYGAEDILVCEGLTVGRLDGAGHRCVHEKMKSNRLPRVDAGTFKFRGTRRLGTLRNPRDSQLAAPTSFRDRFEVESRY